jgi:hypothetical protein
VGEDMSDRRPWTPGPWLRHGSHLYDTNKNIICQFSSFGKWKQENFQDLSDNLKLCQKAPEMAELLIEIVKQISDINTYYGRTTIDDIAAKAKALLEEVGYENLAQD